jgi:ice-binding like protein
VNHGVTRRYRSPISDPLDVSTSFSRSCKLRAGLIVLGLLFAMPFASTAVAAPSKVGLGTAESFSVLAGSTVTNTGPTTMFGDLGLSPGSSVTGAPHVLGTTHVDDAVAIGAKNSLTTAYNDAASRPSDGSAGTDLSGQTFTPGVRSASSSLLLSAGSVTLDAQGDPNAVFIFQIGSTLITGSHTTVQLINGAQACNVFWQVGSSVTLGTGTVFVGTVMASATITANTAATIHGRLLAETGAVNLDTNTITTSNCAAPEAGGGGLETSSPTEVVALIKASEVAATTKATTTTTSPTSQITPPASKTSPSAKRAAQRRAARRAAARRAAARRAAAKRRAAKSTLAHPAKPHATGSFTG